MSNKIISFFLVFATLIIISMSLIIYNGLNKVYKGTDDLYQQLELKSELSVSKIETTSNSIKITIINNNNNIKYFLYKNKELINESFTKDNIIEFKNLKDSSKYNIIIKNNKGTIEKEITTNPITTIRFAGDTMMTSFFADAIENYGVDYMWSDTSYLFKSADYSLVNLETSVSTKGESNKREGYGFRSHPTTLQGLVNAGIDFVTVANNHVLDYGIDAFYDTLDNLNKYKIEHAGAGKNIDEAFKINYQNINDLKIAFLSGTSILGHDKWEATKNNLGLAALNERNYDKFRETLKIAKKNSDYVILNLHWGVEYDDYPGKSQIDLAHSFIDSGADIIIGHHPHVLQGVEHYNNGIIFYSVGNFNFLVSSENTRQSGVFELNLDKDNIISSKIYPTRTEACKAHLLKNNNRAYTEIINNLNERSKQFGTNISMSGFITKN